MGTDLCEKGLHDIGVVVTWSSGVEDNGGEEHVGVVTQRETDVS